LRQVTYVANRRRYLLTAGWSRKYFRSTCARATKTVEKLP
jgi:hypothetical protein